MTDRELDALVAEKVMGWARLQPGNDEIGWKTGPGALDLSGLPEFSTDIAAAWEVVEEIRRRGLAPEIALLAYGKAWGVGFKSWRSNTTLTPANFVHASAPHAICLAALKAVGVELDD